MIIPVVYTSAIQFWLNYTPDFSNIQNGNFYKVDLAEIYDFQVNHELAQQIAEKLNLTYPLSLMSPNKKDKRKNDWFYTIQRPQALPRDSFVEVCSIGSARILVATPELCFLQAASILDLRQSVFLGTELCGIYVYDEKAEYKQRSRNPVTNVGKIIDYLETADRCYGKRDALRATKYILDRSNSIYESMLATMVELPLSLGGHSLKGACMNEPLDISEEGRKILRDRKCIGDLVWKKQKVVLEFDSIISHLSKKQHFLDKKRSSAMNVSGYKVITVTYEDFCSIAGIDNIFQGVRKALGLRSNDQKLKQFYRKRQELMHIFNTFRCNDPSTYPKILRTKSVKESNVQTIA